MATIYQCMYRDRRMTFRCGTYNQGRRAKCVGCGSPIVALHGHAILAKHRGDGRYSMDDAIKEYATLAAAERAASKLYEADNRSNVVARFIFSSFAGA
jgi:hypothetical protein